jgi:two-component system cell cycle sensor histidine kinase/response regulator CckA
MDILIVDDKEENLYYLEALLTANGHVVSAARHGAEALVMARRSPPSVVISDLLMPVMDGYTLLRHWKADEALNPAPFIVYTATYTEPEDERLALGLGADAFILKPAEPEAFLARLDEVLARATTARPSTVRDPSEHDEGLLRDYSDILIRKLEQKTLELEESNRSLQRDIAARKEAEAALHAAEEQLRQAQKMEAVGRLAGGIAHDFNNLLTVILSYANLIIDDLPPGDPLRDDVLEIRRAGERAADLTRQLLAFSRRQLHQPSVVDLRQVVLEMEKLLRRVLGEDIQLVVRDGRPQGRIHADASQIEQIVMNLAVNARDAMPLGGTLTLEFADVELDADYAGSHLGVAVGPYVMLAVTDTGTGIDAAAREHMFEPFFTTKDIGKGTGLGLSTVFGIVTASHGHIDVDTEDAIGSTFRIYFPRTDATEEPARPVYGTPETLRGTETILLVEDDEQVRELNRTILRRNGYHVLDAQDGAQAVLVSEDYEEDIHLLLTDVVMPQVGGRDLADRLLASRPNVRVLYVSGYTEDATLHLGVLEDDIAFLQKPVTPDTLLRKIREVLEPDD